MLYLLAVRGDNSAARVAKQPEFPTRSRSRVIRPVPLWYRGWWAVALCLLLGGLACQKLAGGDRVVTRVIDGDTIVLDGGERVRLIGVDTPESVDPRRPVQYFALEASEYTRRLLQGKAVRLEYDVQRRDRYQRTLAYVFLGDGTLANEQIIRDGYGFAYVKYPFSRMESFRAAEREARQNGRGLWGGMRAK